MSEKPEGYRFIEETQIAKMVVRDDMTAIIAENNKLDSMAISICNEYVIENDYGIHHLMFNSEDRPFAFIGGTVMFNSGFYMNSDYYEKNKQSSVWQIIRTINEYTGSNLRLSFSTEDLTPEMIQAIVNNPNIKEISLRDIPLTRELYDLLHVRANLVISSRDIDPQLEDIFDGSIVENMSRTLVQASYGLDFRNLSTAKNIRFRNLISDKELEYIRQYAKNIEEVHFEEEAFVNMREITRILNNDHIKYKINLESKRQYDLDSFIKLKDLSPNIEVSYSIYTVSLDQYINTEQKLRKMIEPVQGLDLSPLEKYLFAFKTASQFRKYKENDANRQNARNLFALFEDDNTDIVCVGFANILTELCVRLGIECTNISLNVDVSHDRPDEEILAEQKRMREVLEELALRAKNNTIGNLDTVDFIITATKETPLNKTQINNFVKEIQNSPQLSLTEIVAKIDGIIKTLDVLSEGHQRNRIYIKDEKYGVDGIYIADPTWCNYLDHDIYVNALMTPQETLHHKRALYSSSIDLLTAQTYEEFLELVYLEFRQGRHFTFDNTLSNYKDLFPDFESWIEHAPAYAAFKKKIGHDMDSYRELFSDDTFMEPLFQQIQAKCNNVVNGKTIINAAMELNKAMNPGQKRNDRRETRYKLVKDNRYIYGLQFPPIVVEGMDSQYIRANEKNKFDLKAGYFIASDNSIWRSKKAYLESLEKKVAEEALVQVQQPNIPHLAPDYYSGVQAPGEREGSRSR